MSSILPLCCGENAPHLIPQWLWWVSLDGHLTHSIQLDWLAVFLLLLIAITQESVNHYELNENTFDKFWIPPRVSASPSWLQSLDDNSSLPEVPVDTCESRRHPCVSTLA